MRFEQASSDANSDRVVTELVQLARARLSGDPPRREEQSFARLEAKVRAQSAKPRPSWPLRAAALVAAAAVLVLGLSFLRSNSANLTYEVVNGAVGAEGRLVAQQGTRVRFSDGSELVFDAGSESRISELGAHGGRVRIERGAARVAIAKKPGAKWAVEAGPYTVRVTGTAFRVGWSDRDQRFDLAMESGAVMVSGPLVSSELALRAGQHMLGVLRDGRLVVDNTSADAAQPAPAVANADSLQATPESPLAAQRALPGKRDDERAHLWRQQVAQGHFDVVLAEAEERGLERTLGSGSLEDLSALADAARYARRTNVAKRALTAQRQRFPGSLAAAQAAFFLGRLSEDGGGAALEWYDRYLNESPQGSYVPQALGRKMMLVYQTRGASAAHLIADEYVRRYPNGPYAAAARKVLAESARSGP